MIRFEYEITKHSAEEFAQLVYFCTDEGECSIRDVPKDQIGIFSEIINKKGSQGWELVQVFFGKDGVVIFWKRGV
jgi:hypothetical protein